MYIPLSLIQMINRLQQEVKKISRREYTAVKQIFVSNHIDSNGGNKMSFWTSLEADVTKGLEVAAVVVGTFEPQYSTLLMDIAQAFADVESIFAKPVTQVPTATVSAVTQAATTLSTLKQAALAKAK